MSTFQYGENRLLQLANMSLSGLVAKIFSLLEQTPSIIKLTGALSLVLTLLVLAMCIFVSVFTKSDFRRALACAAAVCVVPTVSYYYAIIFMAIPLVLYMTDPCIGRDGESPTLKDLLRGKESMAQLCDTVFWCSAFFFAMAVFVPMRFAMHNSLYFILIVLALTFHELCAIFKCSEQV